MNTDTTLYDKVGAASGIESLVLAFYVKVLADPELAPFFRSASFEKLYAMQREFFAMALGGPVEYTGASLAQAHHGRGISSHHFSLFATHLLETLKEHGLPDEDASEVIERLNHFANEITGTSY